MAQEIRPMIHVSQPQIARRDGLVEVTASIDGHDFYVRWRGDQPPPSQSAGDAMLCFALIPAMAQGRDLQIAAPVSRQLLYQSTIIQGILLRWYPERYSRIAVTALPAEDPTPAPGTGIATTFTGGVDSHYTLMSERGSLTHAVYVHGYDVKLKDTRHREIAASACRAATAECGVELIEVETNIRHYTDPITNWLTDYHGAGLAAVGHLLSGNIKTLLIPASNSYEALTPLGSDPLLDPLWRSSGLDLIHHGGELGRMDKSQAIADWPSAQHHLRVCGENVPGQRNCGRCEKCARTLVGFEILGRRDEFVGNFSAPLTSDQAIAVEVAPDPGKWFDWQGMYERAAQEDPLSPIARGLRQKLNTHDNESLTRELRPHLKSTIESEHWQQRWPKFRNKILTSMEDGDPDWFAARLQKNLPTLREALAEQLAKNPTWLKKKLRRARWRRHLGQK